MRIANVSAPRNTAAFTLVELLVAIGVVLLLSVIGINVLQGMGAKAEQTKEFAAARNLINAYHNYALDHENRLIVGVYGNDHPDLLVYEDLPYPAEGRPSITALHRYPYRLAPYFGYQIKDIVALNGTERQITKIYGEGSYGISIHPAFGINAHFMGGMIDGQALKFPDEVAQRVSAVPEPSKMIVFATTFWDQSSRPPGFAEGDDVRGYHLANPPAFETRFWSQKCNLDARHQGRVLCIFLDGSVRLETVETLDDMRYWSMRAQAADNPNYLVVRQGTGGLGGDGGGWEW